jgi:gamma-glutamylcyclotransferase (GGCT)/AIG2-like uncharacterized protein YtfP
MRVFVYGTLKPGECNYLLYCAGRVIEEVAAYTWGELYHLPPLGYPGMTEGKGRVSGFLLTFADSSMLSALDQLETYDPVRSPEDNEYQRLMVTVYRPSGESLGEAWAYSMTKAKVKQLGGILLPAGSWDGNSL